MSSPLSSAGSSLSSQSSSSDLKRPRKRQRKDSDPFPLVPAATFSQQEMHDLAPRVRPIEKSNQINRISRAGGLINLTQDYEHQLLVVFLQEVKTCSETLTESLEYLLSHYIYSVFANIPWEELDDVQKNHFFSCLFKILESSMIDAISTHMIKGILERNKSCLPLITTQAIFKSFQPYLPRLTDNFTLVTCEHFSQGAICPRTIGQIFNSHAGNGMVWGGEVVTVEIPSHLLHQDAFTTFIKAFSEDIPLEASPLDIYWIYLFARHFGQETAPLKEKCGDRFRKENLPQDFPRLTAALGYRSLQSKTFDSFYAISGPLLYDEKVKMTILKSFPNILNKYIFITYPTFSFLISRQDLDQIPMLKSSLENSTNFKKGQHHPYELCVNREENSLEHWSFFAFFYKRDRADLTLSQCLTILRLTDYYLCDKTDIEDLIIRTIIRYRSSHELSNPLLCLEDDMIVPVVSHVPHSSRLKHELERTIWRMLSNSDNFEYHLTQLKPVINLFDSINLHTLSDNQFHKVAKHFSEVLETLNLDAKMLKGASFEQLLTFKKLKNLKLLNFVGSPLALRVLQGIVSLRSVELIDETERFATLAFTRSLPWESLSIASKKYNTTLLKALPQLKNLTIELSSEQIPAFKKDLKHLQRLLHLNIQSNGDLNATQFLQEVHQLPHIQSLAFDKNRMTSDISCSSLNLDSFVPNLSVIDLHLSFPTQPELLTFYPNLKSLHLVVSMSQMPVFITAFEKLSSLESLSITLAEPPTPTEVPDEKYQQYQLYGDSLEAFEPFTYPDFPDFDFSRLTNLRSFKFTSVSPGSMLSEGTYIALAKINSLEHISLPDQPFSQHMMQLTKKDRLKSLELNKKLEETFKQSPLSIKVTFI